MLNNSNIAEIWTKLKEEYSTCFSSISEASTDDINQRILCNSQHMVIDFDKKLIPKINDIGHIPRAVDMLHIYDSTINLVEFKCGNIDKDVIKLKGVESLVYLSKALKKMKINHNFLDILSLNINFYLVYNENIGSNRNLPNNSNSKSKLRSRLNQNACIAGFFPNYQGTYFSRVEIMSADYFMNNYINLKF